MNTELDVLGGLFLKVIKLGLPDVRFEPFASQGEPCGCEFPPIEFAMPGVSLFCPL